MTILEQRFLEIVPKQLIQIAKQLERLNDFLKRESSLELFNKVDKNDNNLER